MRFVTVVPIALLLTGAVVLALRASQPLAAPPSQPTGAAAHRESPLACNVTALTPEERKRHFDEVSPKLRMLRSGVRELPDGYEIEFPADAATYRLLTEWAAGERLCCPFFDIDVRSPREGGPLRLRLTGREGVKRFIEVDGADWVKQ